jgi:hypothetical protein
MPRREFLKTSAMSVGAVGTITSEAAQAPKTQYSAPGSRWSVELGRF